MKAWTAWAVVGALLSQACAGTAEQESMSAAGSSATGGHATISAGAAGGGTAGGNAASGGSAAGGNAASGGSESDSVNLFVAELRVNAADGCFPRELSVGSRGGPDEGRVACSIGQLYFDGACHCEKPGQAAISAALRAASVAQAMRSGECGGASGLDCQAACGCEIVQLAGTSSDATSDLYACQNQVTPPAGLAGFCLIDQLNQDESGPAPIGNADLVADCPASSKRRLRFLGEGVPDPSAPAFIGCHSSPSP